MNGSGTGYLTDIGLNYMVRAISGLDTTKITQVAFGVGNDNDASSTALTTEDNRDESAVVAWDGTNAGPIFTTTHTVPAGDAVVFLEMGGFTSGNIMPFVYASAISIGGGSPGDTTTSTLTMAFKDSSE